MPFNLPHPEASDGEVWLTNMVDQRMFAHAVWRTKRKGYVAYDVEDRSIPGVWPIFVQRQELIDAGVPIPYQQ